MTSTTQPTPTTTGVSEALVNWPEMLAAMKAASDQILDSYRTWIADNREAFPRYGQIPRYDQINAAIGDLEAALSTAPAGDGVPGMVAELCPQCFGSGLDGGTTSIQCWKCRGAGAVVILSTASTAGKG